MQFHSYAFWQVGLILGQQGQPINILEVDAKGFTLGMRVNLQKVQAERLLVKPMNEKIVGYTVTPNFDEKTLRVELDAVPSGKKKPVGRVGQGAD